jgi:hypothetical protein
MDAHARGSDGPTGKNRDGAGTAVLCGPLVTSTPFGGGGRCRLLQDAAGACANITAG